jgi:hypothetical protein
MPRYPTWYLCAIRKPAKMKRRKAAPMAPIGNESTPCPTCSTAQGFDSLANLKQTQE